MLQTMKMIPAGLALLLAAVTGRAQVVELDLRKCRKMAVENSERLRSADRQLLKSRYEWKACRAGFLPKLSASGLYAHVGEKMEYRIGGGYLPTFLPGADGRLHPNVKTDPATGRPVTGADGNPVFNQYAFLPDIDLELGLRNVWSVGVTLEQPVYLGGKVRSACRMASLGREMADWNVKYSRAEVIAGADEAYWQYLRVKEREKAAEKYLEAVDEAVKSVENACRNGMASQNDLLKARVRRNEAELMCGEAANGLALSGMNLCRTVGIGLHSALAVSDSLPEELPPDLPDFGEDISARPEYRLLEKQAELQESRTALTRADYLPQLGVSAGYSYGDGIRLNGGSDGIASFSALASLKVPVCHWGEGRNKIRAMKAEEETARIKQEETEKLMQLEAAGARYRMDNAAERVKLTRKSLLYAEENLLAAKNRFEVGMEPLSGYLEAQAQWQKAWSDWIDAKAELHLSATRYLKSVGRLAE